MTTLAVIGLPLLSLSAQDKVWTLTECIDHAIENNITIGQRGMTVRQNEVALNTSKLSRLPGASANASENFSFGRGLTYENTYTNKSTTSTNLNLSVDVPVFQGFQIKNDIAAKKLDLEASVADLEKAKDDIRVQVTQSYVQILYDQEILEVSRHNVSLDSIQVVRLTAMLENGKTSSAELAQQKTALSRSKLSLVQAQNDLNLAILDLTQLLELPSPEGFHVSAPSADAAPKLLPPSPESVYETAVGIKSSIKAEELRLESSSVNVKVAKAARMPSLSLNGGLGTNFYTTSGMDNASFGKQMKNNFSQSLGLTLSVPIFSRMRTRNNIRNAELSVTNQALSLESAKKSLYKEIQQAWYNAVNAGAKLESCLEAEASAKESLELTTVKYENGKANIAEFAQARADYLKAESDRVQARYQSLFSGALLDFYGGAEISIE